MYPGGLQQKAVEFTPYVPMSSNPLSLPGFQEISALNCFSHPVTWDPPHRASGLRNPAPPSLAGCPTQWAGPIRQDIKPTSAQPRLQPHRSLHNSAGSSGQPAAQPVSIRYYNLRSTSGAMAGECSASSSRFIPRSVQGLAVSCVPCSKRKSEVIRVLDEP